MPPNETKLNNLVMASTVAKLFKRSQLTITMWRKKAGLPYISISGDRRPAIRFDLEQVREWAKKNDRRIYPLSS